MSANEIECVQCDGEGFIRTNEWPFGPTCSACHGVGWRPMTDDENDAAAERRAEDEMSEPPPSLDELHRAAWELKQGLQR